MSYSVLTNTPEKEDIVALLRSVETGVAPKPIIHPNNYIQHSLRVADGLAGVKEFTELAVKAKCKVHPVRVFQDGPYVFLHVEYDFFGPKVGFAVFRYEGGLVVEHWDNLQAAVEAKSNAWGGYGQLDGPVLAEDLDKAAANKAVVKSLVEERIAGRGDKLPGYFVDGVYIQHSTLDTSLKALAQLGDQIKYTKLHLILGEGNFVLSVSEGEYQGRPTSYYDLFRLKNGKIVEHWDVIEPIPPRSEWKNNNGKFWITVQAIFK